MMENYEEYCKRRLQNNCVPISEIEWEIGLTPQQIAEMYKTPFNNKG